MCESYSEDGRIVQLEMDVMRACIDEPESGMAFLLDPGNQYLGEDRNWYQILWERTCYPVCMVNTGVEPDLDKLVQQISKEARESKEDEQLKKANEKTDNKAQWIVGMICATFIIIAGIVYFGG